MSSRDLNFLVIISDEHRKDAMGCAGHPIVKTPNLDALAARGTMFDAAYTPSPMCVPTRAALATGDWVHKTGHWDSATPYAGNPRSWMRQLRDAGKEVVSIGKLHFRSGHDDNGFTEEILPMHVVGGVGWAIAEAHLRAAFIQEAEGRNIVFNKTISVMEMADVLKTKWGSEYGLPSRQMPKFLLWLLGPMVNSAFTRKWVSRNVGHHWRGDNSKAIRELGMTYRPVEDALIEMFEYMREKKLVD